MPVLITWHSCPRHHKLKQVLSRKMHLRRAVFIVKILKLASEKKHARMVSKSEHLGSLSLRRKRTMWAPSRRQGIPGGGRSSGQRWEDRPRSFSVLQPGTGRVDHIHRLEVTNTVEHQPTFSISHYFKRAEGVTLAQVRTVTIIEVTSDFRQECEAFCFLNPEAGSTGCLVLMCPWISCGKPVQWTYRFHFVRPMKEMVGCHKQFGIYFSRSD